MGKKDNTKINILTGKRPTLSETRGLKQNKLYNKLIVTESEYNQFLNMSLEKQKARIEKLTALIEKKTKPKKVKKAPKENKKKKEFKDNKPFNKNVKHHVKHKHKEKHDDPFKKRLLPSFKNTSEMLNSNGEILFEVLGIHTRGDGVLEPKMREYHWKVTTDTDNLVNLQVGTMATVKTKFGMKRIVITKVIKPRTEKRIQEVKQLNSVHQLSRVTWFNIIELLESKGMIKKNATNFEPEYQKKVQ